MKKFLKFLFALLLGFAAVSCIDEIDGPAVGRLVEKSYTVGFASDSCSTRAFLDEDLTPVWEVGEKVSVYDPVACAERIFTVTAVAEGRATITGEISEGEFSFSAVYPASAVGSWTDLSSVSVNIPQSQKIPSGGHIDSLSLVSRAYAEASQPIIFRNEVSLLKFTVDKDGISTVRFTLNKEGDASYVCTVEGDFVQGEIYYAAVRADSYDGGISVTCSSPFGDIWTKSSSNPLDSEKNGIKSLGTVSDGTKSVEYTIVGEKSYGDLDDYLDKIGALESFDEKTITLINGVKPLFFTWQSQNLKAYVYHHKSIDPDGQPVTLSAIVYIPEKAVTEGRKLRGVVIVNHGTIMADSQRPSYSDDHQLIAAWKGYAVVFSDYCGFGADVAHPQAYLNPDVTARGSIDAYFAACQIMKDKGISWGSDLYNMGYSQGGFNTMANIKYLTEHPELGLKFTKSFMGGSPFTPLTVWKCYIAGTFPDALTYAPITVTSVIETRHLDVPYSRVFKEPLLSHVQDWILSKQYGHGSLDKKIGAQVISDIFTDEIIEDGTYPNKAVADVCDEYSLAKGWKPAAGNKIYIYHSTQDDMVPYQCFTEMKEYLSSVATDSYISWNDGEDGGHSDALSAWVKMILLNW